MDLKVLFHNPESLSDQELAHLRQKIALQRSMPWISAFFGGFSFYFLDAVVLKKSTCYRRIALGGLLGFVLGGVGSYNVSTSVTRLEQDAEIINAFDRKYMTTVLNTTGFGSNYVSIRDYSASTQYKKPY